MPRIAKSMPPAEVVSLEANASKMNWAFSGPSGSALRSWMSKPMSLAEVKRTCPSKSAPRSIPPESRSARSSGRADRSSMATLRSVSPSGQVISTSPSFTGAPSLAVSRCEAPLARRR